MRYIFFSTLFFISTFVFANPKDEKVVFGSVDIDRKKDILNIYQKSDKAIINWSDFSISENEITKIIATSDNAAILNRVVTSNPSYIHGKLFSNAKVFLINQNGILVGNNALIDTKKLVLSTLDIANDEFLNAEDLLFKTDSREKVINKGKIRVVDDVYIIARDVENEGEIESTNGSVNLIGAMDVLLLERKTPKFQVGIKNEGRVSNKGVINAVNTRLKACGNNIYSLAINSEGIIDTTRAIEKNGRVILEAEEGVLSVSSQILSKNIQISADHIHIETGAILDATSDIDDGGNIHIGGGHRGRDLNIKNAKTTYVHEGSFIYANGVKNYNAGEVIIFSEDQTSFQGYISAQGDLMEGGFVEISSKGNLLMGGFVDLRSQMAKMGNLSLDPGSIFIEHSDEINSQNDIFTDSYLTEQLKTSNVEISTLDSSNGEPQTIIINQDVNISWEENTTLSFIANKSIWMKPNSIIQNTSQESFLAIDFKTINENGNFRGITIDSNAQIITNRADIKIEGNGGNIGDSNYGLHIKGGIISSNEDNISGNIYLKGKANRADNKNYAIFLDGSNIRSKNANLIIEATSLATKETNHGICFDNFSSLFLDNSKAIITAKASGTNSIGVNLAKATIDAIGDSSIEIIGIEAGAIGINILSEASIKSSGPIKLDATNSIYSYGQIESDDLVDMYIGREKNGILVLKKPIIAKDLQIHGGNYNDIFHFDCRQKCSIFGGDQENTLIAADFSNVFEITHLNEGILNNDTIFSGIQNLKGSNYHDDIFTIRTNGKLDGQIDGLGGTNTINAPNKNNLWVITSNNNGYIDDLVAFNNIQNLIGGNKNDTFKFLAKAKVGGVTNGSKGYNILDYSSYLCDLIIDLHKIVNINEIIGGNNKNTLIGPEDLNIWQIYGLNSGGVGNIKFENFQNLVGSTTNDDFYISTDGRLDGEMRGGGGLNSIYAPNHVNKWHITGVNRGYIENILSFSNIQNLYGGQFEDTFRFVDYAYITGKIDGMSTSNNILDFSEHTSIATLDLKMIDNIQNIIGGVKTTLIGRDIDNTWDIANENSGMLNKTITFSNIENIIGGSKKDIFSIEKEGHLLGFIDGREGDNTIQSFGKDNVWNIYSDNEGLLNESLTFKNIANLQGSEFRDCFYFENTAKIDGKIDGGLGKDNLLDFSKQIIPLVLDLNRVENVQTIIGSKSSDLLIGRNDNSLWVFSGFNTGYVHDIKFIGFENIRGGRGSDIFIFKDDTGVTGFIDGGNDDVAMNILDYSLCTRPIKANVLNGDVTNTSYVCNIQATVLPNFKSDKSLDDLASFIEIPLTQTDFKTDFYEDSFVKLYKGSDFTASEGVQFEQLFFPIYVSTKGEKVLVYKASSPFVITTKTSNKHFHQAAMGPFLADNRVGDTSTRMKNNLLTSVNNENIGSSGSVNQVNAVYEQEDDGFDLDDFTIITQNIKEKSIKQKPRPLHYYSK